MDALYPRYAKFIRSGDNVVLESGSSSFGVPPMTLADDVQVHIQMLVGLDSMATGATFGIALADPKRKTILITGEGSHQLTANEIGNMGRFGANPYHPLSQQRRLHGGAGARAKSRLVLQRSRQMALCRCAARARMHRLVYRPCRNVGRAGCRTESSPRK